jgi:hypothetical protein
MADKNNIIVVIQTYNIHIEPSAIRRQPEIGLPDAGMISRTVNAPGSTLSGSRFTDKPAMPEPGFELRPASRTAVLTASSRE